MEAEVKLACGAVGRAIAPAGASTGTGEALDLRDGGVRLGGFDVQKPCQNINSEISNGLKGIDAKNQSAVDSKLIALDGTSNKSRLGGNATVAVSMAALHAAAASEDLPLWKYLAKDEIVRIPLPEIQIYGGGAHAERRVDVQDFMVMCPGASSFSEALEWTAEIYMAAGARLRSTGRLRGVADEGGYWPVFGSNEEVLDSLMQAIQDAGLKPGNQVGISLDIAASEFGKSGRYELALERRVLGTQDMIDMLAGWIKAYPILSIEDPVAEDDAEGFVACTKAFGSKCQIIGDDFLVTNANRVAAAASLKSLNAVLLKPNQAGTISETKAALDEGKKANFGTIISARSGETEDVTIAHLSVGWNTGQLKVGSFTRSERMAKWNEVLRIESALGSDAAFAGWSALPFSQKQRNQ